MAPCRPMDERRRHQRAAWRARARKDLCRPRFWVIFSAIHVAAFVLVATIVSFLDWIGPLPWLSEPYVNPDPAPLLTAFCCVIGMFVTTLVLGVLVYLLGGPDPTGRKGH